MSEESGEKSQDDFFILFMTLSMMTMPYFIHKCDCQCGNNKYKMNSYLYSDAMRCASILGETKLSNK